MLTVHCRRKLTSLAFLERLNSVRSLLGYSKASAKPGAAEVLRALLSAKSVPLRRFNTEEQAAARRLHICGMVLIEEEGGEADGANDRYIFAHKTITMFSGPVARSMFCLMSHSAPLDLGHTSKLTYPHLCSVLGMETADCVLCLFTGSNSRALCMSCGMPTSS